MLVDECNKFISENRSGVRKIIVDGNVYWLKVYGENKSTIVRKISSLLSKINTFSLFQTQAVLDSFERFEHEKAMLHYLKKQNFCVPDIDLEGPGYFVTHDEGTPLHQFEETEITQNLLNHIFITFAQLHKKNIVHGRPALRDIIISQEKTPILIDFEESATDASSILQARDIYILLMELCRKNNITTEQKIIALQAWKSEVTQDNWENLLKINRFVKRFRFLPRFVLFFKQKNKLSHQLLNTIALFDKLSSH